MVKQKCAEPRKVCNNLRSKNGRSTACSFARTAASPLLSLLIGSTAGAVGPPRFLRTTSFMGCTNQALKLDNDSKAGELGMRKWSRAHSSVRLFWSGVPVSRRRCSEWKLISV